MIKLNDYILSLDDYKRRIKLRNYRHKLIYKGRIRDIPIIYSTYYITEMVICWLTRRIVLTIVEDICTYGRSKKN